MMCGESGVRVVTRDRVLTSLNSRAFLAFFLLAGTKAHGETCPDRGEEKVEVVAIEPRLELRLADGRLIRLAGFDPAGQTPSDPDLGETSRVALAKLVLGHGVVIHALSTKPDRWKRVVAMAFISDPAIGGRGEMLAARAISSGLGRYLAEPSAHVCRDTLIAAETAARDAKLGLWADSYYGVLAVDDQTAFSERSGTIVLAEGRLTSVVPGPYRTKLRFASTGQGSRDAHMLSATILPRTIKTFEAKRLILPSLIGHVLRLRGLLDLRFGPQIELTSVDDIELIEPAAMAPAPAN